jgi:hypothetical protein
MSASTITRIAVVFACFSIGGTLDIIIVSNSWAGALLCGSISALVGYWMPLEDSSR